MRARIKHIAIVSNNYPRLGKFYQSVFGMKTSRSEGVRQPGKWGTDSPKGGVGISDGYVGLVIYGREAGYIGNFDHFGIFVDDIETVCARLQNQYPSVQVVKRPSMRPFATFSAHDPAGNVFDLTQEGMENLRGVHAEKGWAQERYIKHITIRALEPQALARFYTGVFELKEEEKALEDPNFYLSDGRVTLVIAPWKITDYLGASVTRPGLEHIGFKVESVDAVRRDLEQEGFAVDSFEALKKDLDAFRESDPTLSGRDATYRAEGEVMLKLLSTCRYGQHAFCDPDGVLVDIFER